MKFFKISGLKLWIIGCIIGALIHAFVIASWFYELENYNNLGVLELAFIFTVIMLISFTLVLPFVFYLLIRLRAYRYEKLRIKEYNIVYSIYSIVLYLYFSNTIVNYFEAFMLMIGYYILGLVSLNIYLKQVKTKQN